MEPTKYSAVIKWSLVIGIVIVLNLFINYAISLVYESPKYEDYCKQEQVIPAINNEKACLDIGGQWNPNIYGQQKSSVDSPVVSEGYCEPEYTCRKNFDEAYNIFNRNIFIILVVLGIALVATSFALSFNWILSVSFSMGGILSIIIASMRYWGDADNLVRVVILFLALAALIYFALKKFKN